MSQNSLEYLPEYFWRLSALSVLDISQNNIDALSDSIIHLDLGGAVLIDSGMVNVYIGLFLDSNKLCDVSENIAQWIDTYTVVAGSPTWRNTQKCQTVIYKSVRRLQIDKKGKGAVQYDAKGRIIQNYQLENKKSKSAFSIEANNGKADLKMK